MKLINSPFHLRRLTSTDISSLPPLLRRFASYHNSSCLRQAVDRALEKEQSSILSASSNGVVSLSKLASIYSIEIEGRFIHRKSYTSGQWERESLSHASIDFSSENPIIRLKRSGGYLSQRVSIAHELGHFIVRKRGGTMDRHMTSSESIPPEELIADYIGRRILMHNCHDTFGIFVHPSQYFVAASKAEAPPNIAFLRVFDPDIQETSTLLAWWKGGKILDVDNNRQEFTLHKFYSRKGYFLKLKATKAKKDTASDRAGNMIPAIDERTKEDVRLGTFHGSYYTLTYAWGSKGSDTRNVLTFFREI